MRNDARCKVMIVDDHPIARYGIAKLIEVDGGFEICGEAEDGSQAVDLMAQIQPDIVLLDISLKGANGLELIKTIRSFDKKTQILVVSMHDESLYAERAVRAGAQGYIMKQEAVENIVQAIRQIQKGRIYLSEDMNSRLLGDYLSSDKINDGRSPVDELTDRELEVFHLIGEGCTTKEIAERLFLSHKTVLTHQKNIREKLNIDTAARLVRYAVESRQLV